MRLLGPLTAATGMILVLLGVGWLAITLGTRASVVVLLDRFGPEMLALGLVLCALGAIEWHLDRIRRRLEVPKPGSHDHHTPRREGG